MRDENPPTKSPATRFALLLGVGCMACCALPLIGAATGLAMLAGIAAYLEIALAAVLISVTLVVAILWFRRRRAPACSVNGPCAPRARKPGGAQP